MGVLPWRVEKKVVRSGGKLTGPPGGAAGVVRVALISARPQISVKMGSLAFWACFTRIGAVECEKPGGLVPASLNTADLIRRPAMSKKHSTAEGAVSPWDGGRAMSIDLNEHHTCTACEHLRFVAGEAGYSSWTPGSPMCLECNKGHWDADDYSSRDEFRKAMSSASACRDFTQVDLEQLKRALGRTKRC